MVNPDLGIAAAGIGVTAVGTYFTLRFAWKRDEVTKQAGIATTTGDSIERIMRGFSDLNESLQKEVSKADARVDKLEIRLAAEAEECDREIEELKTRIASLSATPTP